VTQAQQQAAYTQQSDAIAIAQAQQNVTQTIKEQQLQTKATASTANQAASQFLQDMGRLSYDRGAGYAEIFIMREMLGEGAYRTLLATRSLKGAQLQTITQRVTTRLFGALERESASPRR